MKAKFVFIGAGGASLKLLRNVEGIPEAQNFCRFPVGGQFLSFDNPSLTTQHRAKVYGQRPKPVRANVGAASLDSRFLDGKQTMLFRPVSLYSTKFLKNGSWFQLAQLGEHTQRCRCDSRRAWKILISCNIWCSRPCLPDSDRQAELLKILSQRQAPIESKLDLPPASACKSSKKTREKGRRRTAIRHRIVADQDHTIAALLGASPGASTSPCIMLGLLPKAFPEQMAQGWEARIKDDVPSYGRQINSSPALTNEIRRATSETLQLPYIEVPADLNHPNPRPSHAARYPGGTGRPTMKKT